MYCARNAYNILKIIFFFPKQGIVWGFGRNKIHLFNKFTKTKLQSMFVYCIILEGETAGIIGTVKHVLSGHSKIDKAKILMTNGSLMKVEIIAECSPWSILQYF